MLTMPENKHAQLFSLAVYTLSFLLSSNTSSNWTLQQLVSSYVCPCLFGFFFFLTAGAAIWLSGRKVPEKLKVHCRCQDG